MHWVDRRSRVASTTITVRVWVSWWLRWYLSGAALMTWMTGLDPDLQQVVGWIRRGIKVDEAGGCEKRL